MSLSLILCSNPRLDSVKPWLLHERATRRVTDEFYKLGDVERTLGMPISPLCDRRKDTDIAKSQLGFLRFVCRPFYAAVAMELPSHSKALERLDANLREWEKR